MLSLLPGECSSELSVWLTFIHPPGLSGYVISSIKNPLNILSSPNLY